MPDGLCFVSAYRYQTDDGIDLEMAYFDLCASVGKIIGACWDTKPLTETWDNIEYELCFSPKKTFRNDIYDGYKANRKPSTIVGIGSLRALVKERLQSVWVEIDNVESDDYVIYKANNGYDFISSPDKDLHYHTKVPCYDWKKNVWIEPPVNTEKLIWTQSIMGDSTDGIKGCVGIGKVKANKFVNEMTAFGQPLDWNKVVNLFGNEEEALLNMRLVRLDQIESIKNNVAKIKLWLP